MQKSGKSTNHSDHQNRGNELFWHKNRKTDLKNSQNRRTENPNALLVEEQLLLSIREDIPLIFTVFCRYVGWNCHESPSQLEFPI